MLLTVLVWAGVNTSALPDTQLRAAPPLPCPVNTSARPDTQWLECTARRIVAGCLEPIPSTPNNPLNNASGANATVVFTPDATHSYGAQWTRDFYYALSGAPGLLDADLALRSVRYTFAGQRADGCMPDRVTTAGVAVYGPGPATDPMADHAWDNGPFAALLLAAAVDAWPARARASNLFCSLEPGARRALDFVNRSASTGLVWNDVARPNCTYGFTDTVAKTGALLFSSLLYLDAARRMARLALAHGCGDAARYVAEAEAIGAGLDADGPDSLRSRGGGAGAGASLWLAASRDNALPDVWGSAYLVALNVSSAERRGAAMGELAAFPSRYFEAGQVRQLPLPLTWTRCFRGGGCPPNGTYQNGAFWATPLHYVTAALASTGHAPFARQLVASAVDDFKAHGVFECVDRGTPVVSNGVLNYTASATSVLLAARQLDAGS
eukprot:g5053.t1